MTLDFGQVCQDHTDGLIPSLFYTMYSLSDSEWNVRKLGWTRLGENGGVETRGDSISTAVRFTVDSCQLQLIHTGIGWSKIASGVKLVIRSLYMVLL